MYNVCGCQCLSLNVQSLHSFIKELIKLATEVQYCTSGPSNTGLTLSVRSPDVNMSFIKVSDAAEINCARVNSVVSGAV